MNHACVLDAVANVWLKLVFKINLNDNLESIPGEDELQWNYGLDKA